MEWEGQSYGKLLKEYDRKIAVLNHNRIESDGIRHDLYRKRDDGTKLTPKEDAEIKRRCDYEDSIVGYIECLEKLLDKVYEDMDNLKEELGNYSDAKF
jgi:hypothetical protein